MLNAGAMLFFMGLVLAGLLLEPALERAGVPRSAFLLALGFGASEFATRVLGLDTGIRWYNFGPVILHLFLPLLIFEAARRLDLRALLRDGWAIFLLALPLFIGGVWLAGAALYFGIAHAGFPWAVALFAAVVLSGTDPHATAPVLRRAGAPQRVITLVEGEGAFSDTAAVVLFMLLLAATMPGMGAIDWSEFGVDFLHTSLGGIAVGLTAGGIARLICREGAHPHLRAVTTLACAYSAYLAAQDLLQVSGAMAVLAAGMLSGAGRRAGAHDFVDELWEFLGRTTGSIILLLAGVTITLGMFRDQWLAMLIGIGAVLLVRALLVFGALGPLSRLPGAARIPAGEQLLLYWSGARGTMTLALALSLPLEFEAWYTVQCAAYGVVLCSLIVQAGTLPWLLRRCGGAPG